MTNCRSLATAHRRLSHPHVSHSASDLCWQGIPEPEDAEAFKARIRQLIDRYEAQYLPRKQRKVTADQIREVDEGADPTLPALSAWISFLHNVRCMLAHAKGDFPCLQMHRRFIALIRGSLAYVSQASKPLTLD